MLGDVFVYNLDTNFVKICKNLGSLGARYYNYGQVADFQATFTVTNFYSDLLAAIKPGLSYADDL